MKKDLTTYNFLEYKNLLFLLFTFFNITIGDVMAINIATLSEQPIYGSNRLGSYCNTDKLIFSEIYDSNGNIVFIPIKPPISLNLKNSMNRIIGRKQYELTDHLGNVRVVFNDNIFSNYPMPEVLAVNNYYPYGMIINTLSFQSDLYRFGFQGHEMDNEIKGVGNHISFGDNGLDTRLGRRLNNDPYTFKYPSLSSYAVFGNNPINFIDPDGRDVVILIAPKRAEG